MHDQDGLTASTAAVPLVLRRYRLGRRLGAGGFGAVHEAHDERLDRAVAVKVIPADGAAPERARREAMAAARLEHPGIVALFDAGEDADARYLVSELVEGETLAALLADADRPLSDRDVLRIGLSLTDALAHAHGRGVVHRDVKPQNVIVPDRPKTWRGAAKLTDFGVAMLAGDEALTVTGDVVGTLAYMAPEQAKAKPVDARADVYSLALVLYEALAGVNPMRGGSPAATAKRVGTAVPPLGKRRKDLPPALTATLDRALKANPAQRPTLAEVGDALEDALVDVPEDERRTLVRRHPVEREPLLLDVPPGAPRVAHAVAVAALVLACGGLLAAGEPFPWGNATGSWALPWLAAAAGSAAVALLLPRAGWLLALALVAAGLLLAPALGDAVAGAPLPGAGSGGAARGADGDGPAGALGLTGGAVTSAGTVLALLLAALPIPVALLRRPRTWTLPLAAPALGALGLAGAFPALAGNARTAWTRAWLGALGAWWAILAEPLVGDTLLLGDPQGTAERARESVLPGLDAIAAAATSGTLAIVAVWALAALVLPWVVRGWGTAWDVVGATAWAAGLGAATAQVATAFADVDARGVVAGAIVAGVAAVALAAVGSSPSLRSSDGDDVD